MAPDVPTRVICLDAPHFCAAFVTDGTVRRAAPIIHYMVWWPDDKARAYIKSKGWRAYEAPKVEKG